MRTKSVSFKCPKAQHITQRFLQFFSQFQFARAYYIMPVKYSELYKCTADQSRGVWVAQLIFWSHISNSSPYYLLLTQQLQFLRSQWSTMSIHLASAPQDLEFDRITMGSEPPPYSERMRNSSSSVSLRATRLSLDTQDEIGRRKKQKNVRRKTRCFKCLAGFFFCFILILSIT